MCKRLATPLIQGLGTLIYCESQNYYFLSEHENVQFKSIKEGTLYSQFHLLSEQTDKGISTNSQPLFLFSGCVSGGAGVCKGTQGNLCV